jgi:hypothetical protein
MSEDEITTEEAGQRFLFAYRRFRASHRGDEEALREYEDAIAMLLATFADGMGNVSHAAMACGGYCCALVDSAENVKRPRAKAVART